MSAPSLKRSRSTTGDCTTATEFMNVFTEFKASDTTHLFHCSPEPPCDLWDVDDGDFLDKVKCKAWLSLTHIDPRDGLFRGRLKFHWFLRTLNLQERTEPRIRVPGIRLPKVQVFVEESRIWREVSKDTAHTMCWHGTSLFEFSGYEIFEVHDFPFDRQMIGLGALEFVWRKHKDSPTHEETMKVVVFELQITSMLPEWEPSHAVVLPAKLVTPSRGPSHCFKFSILLRLQRKPDYYISNIFFVSFIILVAALLPLAMRPGGSQNVGDRLSLHAGGLLTLVSFKYAFTCDLPVVPYLTYTSRFLTLQIVTIVFVIFECIICYKLVDAWGLITPDAMVVFEEVLLICLLCFWTAFYLYSSYCKKHKTWESVMRDQLASDDIQTGPQLSKMPSSLSMASDLRRSPSPLSDLRSHASNMGTATLRTSYRRVERGADSASTTMVTTPASHIESGLVIHQL